jgi:hypothetical protein
MAVAGTHSPRSLRPLGSKPLVALRVVQEADLQRGASRCEEDAAAADEEVGEMEIARWGAWIAPFSGVVLCGAGLYGM